MKTLLGLGNDVLCSAAALDENDMHNDLQDSNNSQECSDAERDVANYENEDISNNSSDTKALLFMPTVAGITGNF